MSGTKAGGLKAAQTNRAKYGKEFYSTIGRKGGQNGHTGGFAANPAWPSQKSCLIKRVLIYYYKRLPEKEVFCSVR